eukprot:579432-Hanusia_phi.AAC.1
MKAFLQSSSALYIESQALVATDLSEVALLIYDNLHEQLRLAEGIVSTAMGSEARNDDFNLSYIQYRKLKDLYLVDADYNAYAKGSDSSEDNNLKVAQTDPALLDDGTYPVDATIPNIFQQVQNYILNGDINVQYFAPGSGVNRTAKAMKSFSRTTLGVDFMSLGPTYFSAEMGVLQYVLPNLSRTFLASDLDAILASVLRGDETLQDWGYTGYQFERGAFEGYESLADLQAGQMRQTSCLNVKYVSMEPGITQQMVDAQVSLCDAAGACRAVDVCSTEVTYDQRTGQSCSLMYNSLDDGCESQMLHLSSYLGGQPIVMQEHCNQPLFVRELYNDPVTPVSWVSRLDLNTSNPAGSVCLRTDSTCLQDQGLLGPSVEVASVRAVQGVDVYAFYRYMGSNKGDPHSDKIYGPLYKKASTEWYPAWVDCYNVPGINKSKLLDWTGWYPSRVAATKERLLINHIDRPDLSMLDKEAVWSDASYRPSGLSQRCNQTHCVSSTGVATACPNGVCNVARPDSVVHAVALVLNNSTELFCATDEDMARSLCPLHAHNQSLLVMVRNNLWYCKSDCQRVLRIKYIGKHAFRYRTLKESVLGFTAADRLSIGLNPLSGPDVGYLHTDAFRLVHHLVSQQVLGSGKALPGVMYSKFWTPPST